MHQGSTSGSLYIDTTAERGVQPLQSVGFNRCRAWGGSIAAERGVVQSLQIVRFTNHRAWGSTTAERGVVQSLQIVRFTNHRAWGGSIAADCEVHKSQSVGFHCRAWGSQTTERGVQLLQIVRFTNHRAWGSQTIERWVQPRQRVSFNHRRAWDSNNTKLRFNRAFEIASLKLRLEELESTFLFLISKVCFPLVPTAAVQKRVTRCVFFIALIDAS
ncbi:hypothetical protein RRG08_067142 [Elysia crispata]|uniref:Uncharacterized protein n=1 Tax=Elysia crispata TaxID=231223 RepID=A0AAE1DGA0_9GAST|nr:hypothetical protein RRG08_067142 [Elysia crispata]